MSIGKLESLVRTLILEDTLGIMEEFVPNGILLAEPASGASLSLPYMVIYYDGQNEGPLEALMIKGFLEIDVLYAQKNYDKINNILNKLRILLHGTRLSESGYFASCSYLRDNKLNITENRKNVLGKTIRFEVHEAF